TPHAGELARMLGPLTGEAVDREDVERAPLDHARALVAATGATVLLKGATTVVVGPVGPVLSQADGPAWLATAGAGDVLTGLLGALLAARAEQVAADPEAVPVLAAVAAAVHGRAAAGIHPAPGGPVAALDVADALPATVARLLG